MGSMYIPSILQTQNSSNVWHLQEDTVHNIQRSQTSKPINLTYRQVPTERSIQGTYLATFLQEILCKILAAGIYKS